MATNPAKDKVISFNIRILLPPTGSDYAAGVGSAYLFDLKPGDTVTAIGPFGEFHIKETGREMVYLGGGSGMAPLKSHLAYLLETQQTRRRISYWYGARSMQDLYYTDYFEDLAAKYGNFSFQAALSEPRPEDDWDGPTGFIHVVLKRTYLDTHPNPSQIDYYLCGPPVMIQAAVKMLKEHGVPAEQIAYDEF